MFFLHFARASVSIPVISNGNIRTYADALANLAFTGAVGVMSGEGILTNPAIFSDLEVTEKIRVSMARQYLEYCERNPPPVKWAVHHLLHIFEPM